MAAAGTTRAPRGGGARWAFLSGPSHLWELIAAAAGPESAARRRFLVKVNWFSPPPGNFTGPAALDMLLRALPGPAVIVESHSSGRTDGSRWVQVGQAVGEARDWLRGQERDFLRYTGLGEVMERHGASCLNVTEEVWAGRTVDPEVVRRAVRDWDAAGAAGRAPGAPPALAPLAHEELLASVPAALYELRHDALFIDFARLKLTVPDRGFGFSLGLKNLFGLIPEPDRSGYHQDLPRSILEINAIYHALFDMVAVCEAVQNAVVYREGGAIDTPAGSYDVVATPRPLAVVGSNPLEVDAVAACLFGVDLSGRALFREAARAFPSPDPATLAAARAFGRREGLWLAGGG